MTHAKLALRLQCLSIFIKAVPQSVISFKKEKSISKIKM